MNSKTRKVEFDQNMTICPFKFIQHDIFSVSLVLFTSNQELLPWCFDFQYLPPKTLFQKNNSLHPFQVLINSNFDDGNLTLLLSMGKNAMCLTNVSIGAALS